MYALKQVCGACHTAAYCLWCREVTAILSNLNASCSARSLCRLSLWHLVSRQSVWKQELDASQCDPVAASSCQFEPGLRVRAHTQAHRHKHTCATSVFNQAAKDVNEPQDFIVPPNPSETSEGQRPLNYYTSLLRRCHCREPC